MDKMYQTQSVFCLWHRSSLSGPQDVGEVVSRVIKDAIKASVLQHVSSGQRPF